MSKSHIILSIIILVLLALVTYQQCSRGAAKSGTFETKRDTVIIEVPSKPIIIDSANAKIVYRIKKVEVPVEKLKEIPVMQSWEEEEVSFTASIDTTIARDTVKVSYQYPLNVFNLEVRKAPDSLKTITIYRDKYIKQNETSAWWEPVAYVAGGILIGLIIGK